MEESTQKKDDIAGVRATTNPDMQASQRYVPVQGDRELENNDDEDNDDDVLGMKFCLLTDNNATFNKESTDSSNVYLSNVAKALGIDIDKEKRKYENLKSYRTEHPVNEFTTNEFSLVAAFPNVFMFGKAYNKHVSNLNRKDCIHLFNQFSSTAATCRLLIFYLFDIQRRHNNIRGISGRYNADREAFEKLSQEITTSAFQSKVQNAVADPKSKDAKYVLKRLIPVLTSAGKNTSYGCLQKNASLGEMYAMMRRFGPQFAFVTIAIDDVNNPHIFRLTFSQRDNETFPSTASRDFLNAMQKSAVFAEGTFRIPTNWSTLATAVTNNPVASAFMFKRLFINIVNILIGIKPAKISDEGLNHTSKVTLRFTPDSLYNSTSGILAGHAVATSAVIESSQR